VKVFPLNSYPPALLLRYRNVLSLRRWGNFVSWRNNNYTHPMKEDVKKKRFSPPLGKMRVW